MADSKMFYNLVLILICICVSLIKSKALECDWMSCYNDELEDCKKVTSKTECFRGVLVVYREAPLFLAKKKCCDKFNIEAIRNKFLYCVKSLQNGTHLCEAYADRQFKISTKNNCNKFGCARVNGSVQVPDDDDDETESPKKNIGHTTEEWSLKNLTVPPSYHESNEESTGSSTEIDLTFTQSFI